MKLLNTNIIGKLLKVLRDISNNVKSCVRVGNTDSTCFPYNGVRQGENMSLLFFLIYFSDLKEYISGNFFGLPFIQTK